MNNTRNSHLEAIMNNSRLPYIAVMTFVFSLCGCTQSVPEAAAPPVTGSSGQSDAKRAGGSTARAGDKSDPSGIWTWSVGTDESKLEMKLELRLTGVLLMGTIEGSKAQMKEIDDASFKDGEVAFSVTRNRKDGKVITRYKGKLEGDTIKGKAEVTQVDGKVSVRDWEAERN